MLESTIKVAAHSDNQLDLVHPAYRPGIDGLRAIAVVLVIGFHAFPDWIPGGFIGVDIFFVISGFLISSIIYSSLENKRFSYLQFYSRRIKRIFPALILILVSSFAFGWYVLLPNEYTQLEKHVAASAGFVSNFTLWGESGYFDNTADTKPLQHLWSLAIEEQFYILWPLILGLVWKRKYNFLAITLAIAAISFLINVATAANDPITAFYSPLSRFWELMIGGILAYLTLHKPEYLNRKSNQQAAVGVALISIAVLLLGRERMFPGWWALLPTFGTFLIISAGPSAWLNQNLLSRRALVWLGLISYPLYLWHWPLLVFLKMSIGRNLVIVDKLIVISVSVCLAFLTYRLLEIPIKKRIPGNASIALASSLAFTLLLSIFGYVYGASPRNTSDVVSRFLLAEYDWEYPDGLEHRIFVGRLRRAYEYRGNLSTRTVFIGDSNMEQYYSRVKKLISEMPDDYNSAVFVGNQRQRCNPIVGIFLTKDNECDSVMRNIESLANDGNTQSVVLAYAGASYDLLTRGEVGRSRFSQFIRSLKKNGKRVYVLLNMPDGEELDPANMFTGSRLTQLTARDVEGQKFDYQGFIKRYAEIRIDVERAALDSGATLVDPLKYLCSRNVCPIFDGDGSPLYKDSKHMRASYARESARYIDATLKPGD